MERKYELLVLLKHDSPPEKTQAAMDKIHSVIDANNGKMLVEDNWGKKKLAYEVLKQSKGIYILYTFLSGPTLIIELERNLRINPEVMKFITVKLADKVNVEEEIAEAAKIVAAKEAAQTTAEPDETRDNDENEGFTRRDADKPVEKSEADLDLIKDVDPIKDVEDDLDDLDDVDDAEEDTEEKTEGDD